MSEKKVHLNVKTFEFDLKVYNWFATFVFHMVAELR